ncbi:MAG: hypothetical protein LBS21_05120 [Clostridiales bacterium]|nr:hypothetical protein [Clostridiales bacterium]
MTKTAGNKESFNTLQWVLNNAEKGFYLFTASALMQRKVAEHYKDYGISIYDYTKNNAKYSFGKLAGWANKQKTKIFFVINMQDAFKDESDMQNLNLSRDLLSKTGSVWIFGMTKFADDKLVNAAMDFYSFIRVSADFDKLQPRTANSRA